MECDTSKTLKMDIIVLLTQKFKSLKKKSQDKRKSNSIINKVRYSMQKLQRNPQSPPTTPQAPNKKLSEILPC